MLRFLITDILFTVVLTMATVIYVTHLEDKKHISREEYKKIAEEASKRMYDSFPQCMKTPLPTWLVVPIVAFSTLLAPLWISWYVFEIVKGIDKYDPEEEST